MEYILITKDTTHIQKRGYGDVIYLNDVWFSLHSVHAGDGKGAGILVCNDHRAQFYQVDLFG